MFNIDVNKYPVEPPEDLRAGFLECFRERNVISWREDRLVLQDVVDPLDERDDILRGRQLHRLLVATLVGPEIFVLGAAAHHQTVGISAGTVGGKY